MKQTYQLLAAGVLACLLLASAHRSGPSPYGLKNGTPTIQSINALVFGPDGILFIGDSKSASVFAVDTKDRTAADKGKAVDLKNIDQKIAAVLGTQAASITTGHCREPGIEESVLCRAKQRWHAGAADRGR
jgi:hypothetical protein